MELLAELRAEGINALDVHDPAQREQAVSHTLERSLYRLSQDERDSFDELTVFGEDVRIPLGVAVTLRNHTADTGGWTQGRAQRLGTRPFDLGLLADFRRDPDEIVLHDVLHAYLRHRTRQRRSELAAALIDAHRSALPHYEDGRTAWADLPGAHYLWSWLASHLRASRYQDVPTSSTAQPPCSAEPSRRSRPCARPR